MGMMKHPPHRRQSVAAPWSGWSRRGVDLTQFNMHHSKTGASALLGLLVGPAEDVVQGPPGPPPRSSSTLSSQNPSSISAHSSICLIQEPYTIKNKVVGFGSDFTVHAANREDERLRACILTSKNVVAEPLGEFSGPDLMAVRTRWKLKTLVLASCYMPYDSVDDPPPEQLRRLVDYCHSKKLPLVVGADANAQHTFWGSTKVNRRGELLLNYLLSTNLEVMNEGSEPTFVNSTRAEVIDMTLANSWSRDLVLGWNVSPEDSGSDHRFIRFSIGVPKPEVTLVRNIRKANWTEFQDTLQSKVSQINVAATSSIQEAEQPSNQLLTAVGVSLQKSCPWRAVKRTRKSVSWWSDELTHLRRDARTAFSMVRRGMGTWEEYVSARNRYNSVLRAAKTASWRQFCSDICGAQPTARIFKIIAAGNRKLPQAILRSDGKSTSVPREMAEELLKYHFPEDTCPSMPWDHTPVGESQLSMLEEAVTLPKIKWAVNSFSPYKSPGPDGVHPITLHNLPAPPRNPW